MQSTARALSSPRASIGWLVALMLAIGCTPIDPDDPDPTPDRGPDSGPVADSGPDSGPVPDAAPETDAAALVDAGPEADAAPPPPPQVPETVLVEPRAAEALGSPLDSPVRRDDEAPHTATLTRAYHIGAREVTQAEFASVMGYNPSGFVDCGGDCPVEEVSWHEAAAYANGLSAHAGLAPCYACEGDGPAVSCAPVADAACPGYRLPTEAEWEIAARTGRAGMLQGGRTLADPEADAASCDPALALADGTRLADLAWYCANSGQASHPVGQKAPNAWGLYDVMGNVEEWCHDWYGPYAEAATDPMGPAAGDDRVLRGGRRGSVPHELRLARRSHRAPTTREVGIGFRIARSGPALDDGCPPADACPDCVEVCDGIDNDCDGTTDEGPDGRPLTEVCYEGPAGTDGVGPCAEGERACIDGAFGACDGQILPAAEACDGIDNDCDGTADDVPGAFEPCAAGVGACAAAGVRLCDAATGGLGCDAVPGPPTDEICDGLDNDCDGAVDDVDGLGDRCEVGVGACRSVGLTLCTPDGFACGAVPQDGTDRDHCGNGVDDDCDGEADEAGCIVPCAADPDCGVDNLCDGGACRPGNCRDDADCGDGALCEDAFCLPGDCRADDQCGPGEICDALFCVPVPAACEAVPNIRGFGTIEGDTTGAPSEIGASCAGGARSPENIYLLNLSYAGTVCIDTFGSAYDTALYARDDCARPSTERACNDDTLIGYQSRIELDLGIDDRPFVFVDGYAGNNAGAYRLTVRAGPCAACDDDSQCSSSTRCIEPPLPLPEVEFEVDGRANCNPDNPVPVEGLAPWPAYSAFYLDGFITYDANDGRKGFGIAVQVDGQPGGMAPLRGRFFDPADVAEANRGLGTGAFSVGEGSVVEAYFPDAFCGDNLGRARAVARAVRACSDACAFDDDCWEGTVCDGRVCRRPRDTDGDGTSDDIDLDDDNDGIPDAVECFGIGPVMSVNGSFERPLPPPELPEHFDAVMPGWQPANIRMEVWVNGFLGGSTPEGLQYIELNGGAPGDIYQDLELPAGTRVDVHFLHKGRQAANAMSVRIGPPGAVAEVLQPVTDFDEWVRYDLTYVIPANQPITRFEFVSLVPGGIGNFLDGVHIVPRCNGDEDADGDGVPNHRDLDANGDGVPDAAEAGHGLPVDGDGRVPAPYGANGLADGIETAVDSGDVLFTPPDADGDGTPDFLR